MRVTAARARGRLAALRARALAPALILLLAGCKDRCPELRQMVVITPPDSELQALIDPCAAHRPAAGETCAASVLTAYPPIDCGCLPLCQRVLEILDQFPGPETIEACHYVPGPVTGADGGAAAVPPAEVFVTYRPSSCP